jgi:uncharacterized protein YndB with AHSA1/START domain
MTIKAEIEIQIARPADVVWHELMAIERFPEWLKASGVTRVEREPVPLGAGTRLRIEQRIAGRSAVLDGIVTVFEPPSRFAFRATHPDGITVDADAQVFAAGLMSRLRWSLQVGLPLRLRLFESMAAPEVRRAAATDLMGLKRKLEAVAG